MTLRLVILESPYAGDIEANVAYARRCVRDCVLRGESPIASHLLFTQPDVLDDDDPGERALGMEAGHAWIERADASVVYEDYGVSIGMHVGINRARDAGIPVEYRRLNR
jgi:hypothetical protein